MRVLIVGSNPSIKSKVLTAFWKDTKSAKVISDWIAAVDVQFEMLTTANVYNQPTPKNRPLSIKQIKSGLPSLKETYEIGAYDKVIALGNTASKALDMLKINHYKMPHPSGRNRKLNDKKFVQEKINGLKIYLSPLPETQ